MGVYSESREYFAQHHEIVEEQERRREPRHHNDLAVSAALGRIEAELARLTTAVEQLRRPTDPSDRPAMDRGQ